MVAISIRRPDSFRRLDEAIESFESALQLDRTINVRDFLPADSAAEDSRIAMELLCVDLNYRFGTDGSLSLDEYRERFPEWLGSTENFGELAREEYRLRLSGKEPVKPSEYSHRYGIDTRNWPIAEPDDAAPSTMTQAAQDTQLHGLQAELERLTGAITELPQPGEMVAGCEIIETLGRGAFGVVYLAKQNDLAARQVVLKLTTASRHEPTQLARLQHTNIVPIYSLHEEAGWQTICMPFFGRTTLDDVLRRRRALPAPFGDALSAVTEMPVHGPASSADVSLAAAGVMLPERVVITIARQLAAALNHGHQRGIIHRDLKPANVLLSEDGAAMVLDYNLSDDAIAGGPTCWQVGGTLPYMSPEHLQALRTGAKVGATADIYALGVLLYQMLTGQLPFPGRSGPFDETLAACIEDRKQLFVPLAARRHDIAPALESIVTRMLAYAPSDRYQSMAEVVEDLTRHETHHLLRYAPNVSLRERATKWCRRHPKITSAVSVATIAATLLTAAVVALVANQQRLAHQQAIANLRDLRDELPSIRAALSLPGIDSATRRDGLERVRQQLRKHGSLHEKSGLKPESLIGLSTAEVEELRGNVSECLALLALSASSGPEVIPVAVGNSTTHDDQQLAARLSRDLAPDAPSQRRIAAIRALQSQDYVTASQQLEALRDNSPYDVSLWLLLGNAYAGLQRWSEAEGCYTVCVTHWPASHVGYFYRGLARVDQRRYAAAIQDFTAALARRQDLQAAYTNRAIASRELQAWDSALHDLNDAIALDASQPRLFLLRSQIYRQLNRPIEAASDRETALNLTPPDARNWIERGLAQLQVNPDAALYDFQQALALEPNSWEAARNIALIHAEFQHRPDDALIVLNRLLEREPRRCADVVSRAVIRARMGNRDQALTDAKQAGQLNPSDKELFQLACVYALTSRQESHDALTAIALLDEALRRNPNWLPVAQRDPDLDALRQLPDFQRLINESQAHDVRRKESSKVISTD